MKEKQKRKGSDRDKELKRGRENGCEGDDRNGVRSAGRGRGGEEVQVKISREMIRAGMKNGSW